MPLITGPTTDRIEALAKHATAPRVLVLAAVEMIEHAETHIRSGQSDFKALLEAREIIRIVRDWLQGAGHAKANEDAASHAKRDIRSSDKAVNAHYSATCWLAWMVEDCVSNNPDKCLKRLVYIAYEARQAVAAACDVEWVDEGRWQCEHLESAIFSCAQDHPIGARLRTSTLAD